VQKALPPKFGLRGHDGTMCFADVLKPGPY